ncbi:ATP-binding domain-containing protein [Hyphobacterium indicum]|uniref:ATP-binding domain-containing protein n=1 Tax=Hyphobacterium indicum TaxID=2162714 RepID=UPI000F638AD8|nr:ATP-binding domain-containing protein [Hyphobacterium indicum]
MDQDVFAKEVAGDALAAFKVIYEAASEGFLSGKVDGANVLADLNQWNGKPAFAGLRSAIAASESGNHRLREEPAIARVVVETLDGKELVFFVCRSMPPRALANLRLASQRSPVGRLAALEPGDELVIPQYGVVFVLRTTSLKPVREDGEWDSSKSVFRDLEEATFSLQSFRKYLADTESTDGLLAALLDEEAPNLVAGEIKERITRLGLRDQPILDKIQDEIFRLPIDHRLYISGPPGTGKTTTLIRRLGLKLDLDFLSEEDTAAIERSDGASGHTSSWTMFTPTQLLRQYLKESFQREGIPAPDARVIPWEVMRRELARSVFPILRSATRKRGFVENREIENLRDSAIRQQIAFFEEFKDWQSETFFADLIERAKTIRSQKKTSLVKLGEDLLRLCEAATKIGAERTLIRISAQSSDVINAIQKEREAINRILENQMNQQLASNKRFLDELISYLEEAKNPADETDEDEDVFDVEDNGDEAPAKIVTRRDAFDAYKRALSGQARAKLKGRAVKPGTRNALILEWLGERQPDSAIIDELGTRLELLDALRPFRACDEQYVFGLPSRYRAFRRASRRDGTWFSVSETVRNQIHPLETDVIILASILSVRSLFDLAPASTKQGLLERFSALHDRFVNQVFIDEATDFSPVQLACMNGLARPVLDSVFLCGDFNQRLTPWGASNRASLQWAFPNLEFREINIGYRQSRILIDFAQAIAERLDGEIPDVQSPDRVEPEGRAPTLLEGVEALTDQANWISERIREVYRDVGNLPATAIFVESEDQVKPVASALEDALSDINIDVKPCLNGEVMGDDSSVRVFDVKHIKGLEFEAAFMLGVDRLEAEDETALARYLYVGSTRAASYFGVVCAAKLPTLLAPLRERFVANWSAS